MKHLKIYENYQTEEKVAKICQEYGIKNWRINQDGLVDVDSDVNLSYRELKKLPLRFGIVTGGFYCFRNKLTTLEGAPQSVDGSFYCDNNNLTTLEGAPQSVGSDFRCRDNKLITLEGAPQSVGGYFDCSDNELTKLEGAPQSVDGSFYCYNNKLTTLEGAPQSVGGNFDCDTNLLPTLIQNNMKWIKHILANQEMYHIYNKDGSFNEYRFQLMMDSMD